MQSNFIKLCEKLFVNQNKRILTQHINMVNILEFKMDPALLISLLQMNLFCQRSFVLH